MEKTIKYVDSASKATLWQFKQVIDTGDVRYLLLLDSYEDFPECDIDKLTIAWYNIYDEWSTIVGGNRSDIFLIKQKQITLLTLQYEQGQIAMRMLKLFPVKELIDEVNAFGYEIDPDNFDKTYEKAKTQLTKLKHKISLIKTESKVDEEPQDFDSMIVSLEKFQGYAFDDGMKVKKFANIYKKYKDAG